MEDTEKLPVEETVKLGENENKTPKTTSEGEYSEEKKVVMSAMKTHYGEDIPDEEYVPKLEKMVAGDLLPKAEKLSRYDESNERILAMMEDEPELSGILSDMSQGGKFTKVLPKYVDVTALNQSGDDDMAEWENNVKVREANYANKKERMATIAANEEKSQAIIAEFVAENKLDEPTSVKFGEMLADFLDKAFSGEITKDFLNAMFYYMNRDTELENQRKVGELKAKNERIATEFMNDDQIHKGDGLPSLGGSGSEVESEAGAKNPIASRLDKYLDTKKSIINR